MTERFASAAELMSRVLGMPDYGFAKIGHPVSSATDAGLEAMAKSAIEQLGGTVILLERTDDWVQARPRSRRIPINRELKRMRVGKVGGPSRREALAALAAKQES